jgi:hypothetical protein
MTQVAKIPNSPGPILLLALFYISLSGKSIHVPMASSPKPCRGLSPKVLRNGSNARSTAWQMEHRLDIIFFLDITPGSRVLEIACGQGDCTIVPADAVEGKCYVGAVDPGAPGYGMLC